MRVLVADKGRQGRANDFNWCVEGELVYLQGACDRDLRDPDNGCGCGRAFGGLSSHRATTTARVVESELSEADVREAVRASLDSGGWLNPAFCSDEMAAEMVDDAMASITTVANHFPAGVVLRRRLDTVYVDCAPHGTPVPGL